MGVSFEDYVEFRTMSVENQPTPIRRRESEARVPQATFTSLAFFLKSLTREDLRLPIERPPSMNHQTWAQVHSSLSALGLLENDRETLPLHRFVNGEITILAVLESAFGADVIAAIERGERCAVGTLANIQRERTNGTIYRFETLVRMALKEQGRPPGRRSHNSSWGARRAPIESPNTAPARRIELALLELEGHSLVRAFEARLAVNDLDSVQRIGKMLRNVRAQIKDFAKPPPTVGH